MPSTVHRSCGSYYCTSITIPVTSSAIMARCLCASQGDVRRRGHLFAFERPREKRRMAIHPGTRTSSSGNPIHLPHIHTLQKQETNRWTCAIRQTRDLPRPWRAIAIQTWHRSGHQIRIWSTRIWPICLIQIRAHQEGHVQQSDVKRM